MQCLRVTPWKVADGEWQMVNVNGTQFGQSLPQRLAAEAAVLVTVEATQGSVPRDAGSWMAVFAHDALGSIGGGKLEYEAMAHARALLRGEAMPLKRTCTLGPSLGQCCGGVVRLGFARLGAADAARMQTLLAADRVPVVVFGAGHVGHALVHILATLPMQVVWVDSRDAVFPHSVSAGVQCEYSDPPHSALASVPAHSRVVVASHSHTEDLDIVAACLLRQRTQGDLPYVGLIGSRTKWASFRQRLEARGFSAQECSHVTSPIGVAGVADKRPEVIAVAVAAQLLQMGTGRVPLTAVGGARVNRLPV